MKTAAVLIVAAVLGGCGGAYYEPSSCLVEVAGGPAELVLKAVVVKRDGVTRELALDAPVHAGDDLALALTAPAPVYLYVVNLAPDGSSQLVWPSEVPQVLDGSLRIPEQSWFRLSGHSGPEVVALIASREHIPLSRRGQRQLVQMAKREARRGDLAKLQAAHPPGFVAEGHATMGLRAQSLQPTASGIRVRTGADTVVLLLDLDHRPQP